MSLLLSLPLYFVNIILLWFLPLPFVSFFVSPCLRFSFLCALYRIQHLLFVLFPLFFAITSLILDFLFRNGIVCDILHPTRYFHRFHSRYIKRLR
jgi:hypothetical protein